MDQDGVLSSDSDSFEELKTADLGMMSLTRTTSAANQSRFQRPIQTFGSEEKLKEEEQSVT